MNTRLTAFLIALLMLASLPAAFVQADPLVDPVLCEPTASIMYNDFDKVIARVFIPIDCPVIGDGTVNPFEVLESGGLTLQRKSVAPGGDINTTPITEVASLNVDVTTFTTVHTGTLLRKDYLIHIVPSYTTTDYHRVVFAVSGSQGANTFAERAASAWLAMPPPPLPIDDFAVLPQPTRPPVFGSLQIQGSQSSGTRGG